uniref:Uncharacterized protein n=1 Tax=Otolemur garnettii TaxID=30611 RepID=H0XJV5_OTOGA
AAKDSLQTERCDQKGKGEQRESRPKWLTKKRTIYLQKTEKLKLRRAQPLMKPERKKPSLIHITSHGHQGSLSPVCTIQRKIFINYFVTATLKTLLRRRESHLMPFFKCKAFYKKRSETIRWLFMFWYSQKIVWDVELCEALSWVGTQLNIIQMNILFLLR